MGGNIKKRKMKSLTITKDNCLDFLELWSSLDLMKKAKRAGEASYFLQQLKKFCKVVPEFTYQPIFYRWNDLWRYDSEHFWEDDVGRCSIRFQNTYFGFRDTVNKFESIRIDWKSFGIEQVGKKKVKRLCGVPVDYLSAAQQKAIKEQQASWEREQKISEWKKEYIELIAELDKAEKKCKNEK